MRKDKKKDGKTSFFSDMKAYFRAVKINYKLDPRFFWMQFINAIGNEIRPLINSFLAALILNGLYAGKSEKTLMLYALIVVFVNFLINLEVLFTANRRYIRKSMWYKVVSLFFNAYSEKMDYAYFEDIRVKDMRRKIDRNISQGKGISNFWSWYHVVSGFSGLIASSAILITMLAKTSDAYDSGILHWVNTPWVILLFIGVIILAFGASNLFEKGGNQMWRKYNDFYAENFRRAGKLEAYPTNTKLAMDMNIYGLDRVIGKCTDEAMSHFETFCRTFYTKQGLLLSGSVFIEALMKFLACCFVGLKALSGAFGIGSLVLYVATILQFSNAIGSFGTAIGNIRGSRKIYDDEFAYLDLENHMTCGKAHPDVESAAHTVEFRDVSFRYPNCEAYSLRHVSLKFSFGERLAVVGMNGSGKTTFIKLLCRLYDPDEGVILLDGKDIREYDYTEYLKLFSVVFQDFKLFAFPLAENVAVGRGYDAEKVEKCLKDAGLGERLKTMPKGIETCIYKSFDPEGVEISGGEAQKIALARALYKDAPIVVLDEPTAALDPIAEAEIYSHFNDMVSGKTAVYISHRLSSCRFCTRIAVFDEGSVVQFGTHEALLADKTGKYSELWNAQAQYYVAAN